VIIEATGISEPLPIAAACSPATASPSAWTVEAHGGTTSSSSGYGAASNTRRSICEHTKPSARREARLVGISTFATDDDLIRALTTAPRIKPTSIFLRSARRPMGQRACRDLLARGLRPIFVVHGQFRKIQRNLWLTRRGDRFHDMALDFGHCHSAGCRTGCRVGAPDGALYDDWPTKADGRSRGSNGRYGGLQAVGITSESGDHGIPRRGLV
jgi:hypothetical protein